MPTNAEFLRKYPNPCFIETGSYVGDGIQSALDAGFKNIHSIELSPKYHRISTNRFRNNPCVTVHFGDSAALLPALIASINTPITFWLDGHWSCDDTALGSKATPLMEELDAIAAHPIKTHTILIDDLRCWKREDPIIQFNVDDVRNKVLSLNSQYRLTCEDSARFPADILVATV
jgi:hypothetical protein